MSEKARQKDLVLVHARTEDGKGLHVVRKREDQVEAGVMRPLEEGKAIHGEVVKLTPRPEFPLLFDAETQMNAAAEQAPRPRAARGGPAQVATESYRKNWDSIWKRRAKKGSELAN